MRLVDLTNIRLFKDTPSVDVPFPEPPVNSGQWIILTAENGIARPPSSAGSPSRGEVYVMRRDGSRVEIVQRDIRPGHDVDRVLFEQFGIEHTFDKETRSLLQQHREMLERGARIDDPARMEVEDRGRQR